MGESGATPRPVPPFDRDFLNSGRRISCIGGGFLGGKAAGLVLAADLLDSRFDRAAFPSVEVAVPSMAVLGTDVFDEFIAGNRLREVAFSGDRDERIAMAFQRADLPAAILGDLRALVETMHTPLAVRSSSLLEDALDRPFAGVYATKMIPNNHPDPGRRFQALTEAIKFVFASQFFAAARSYIRTTARKVEDEKMAVIIQELVGMRHDTRFYPHLSGVGRSYNFYPTGRARPEDGVVHLALGLGKTIVDGGLCWTYSPAFPKAPPPFSTVRDQLKGTQVSFWAVNMGPAPEHNPVAEDEYLVSADLAAAEYDGALTHLASTYVARSDRLLAGTGAEGPRVLNFAPLLSLQTFPVNDVVRTLLETCRAGLGAPVEIEFAAVFPLPGRQGPARLGFLQVRPMVVSDETVEVTDSELAGEDLLVGATTVMGNGTETGIRDIVYVRPQGYEARHAPSVASELERINNRLLAAGRPYLLIGFGRWGSCDPWLGIPVTWGQICGARAIVEATLPVLNVEPSQGSHFFHNISSSRVSYFFVHHEAKPGIDWAWLDEQPAVVETDRVRHLRLETPLEVRVDGHSGRGIIRRGGARPAAPEATR